MRARIAWMGLSLWVLGCGTGTERPPPGAAPQDDDSAAACGDSFARDVEPVLRGYCLRCHSDSAPSGGLSVSSYGALMSGGSGGAVVVPGDCPGSPLVQRVTGERTPLMPPQGYAAPTDEEIGCLCAWIDGGARDD